MMRRRAELRSWKHLLKSSDASRGSQRGHSSRRAGKPVPHGEGPQLIGSLVATLLDGNAWGPRQMPVERERGVSPIGGRRVR